MAINFPSSPMVNDVYTFNGYSWKWNGSYWAANTSATSSGVSQIVPGTNITISPSGGTGTVTINSSLSSMTQTQRTSIVSPSIGLMVYQTDGSDGIYIYKVAGWVQII